jgi:outer membrane protein insertion porin family
MSSVPLRLVSAHLTACRRRTTAGLALVLVLLAVGCREGEGVRVDALDFEGNAHFSGSTLADVFATRDTGPLPWSRVRYFDRATFDADVDRLRAFYRDRGYPDASVTVDVQFNDARDAVRLRVAVAEGEPLIVERVSVDGLDGLPATVAPQLAQLPLEAGAPRDQALIAASAERIAYVLRDSGYARARVSLREIEGAGPNRTVVIFAAEPGPATTFGEIAVEGLQRVNERVVRRALSVTPGTPYRESSVLESQRRLSSLGVFDFAHVGERPDRGEDADLTLVPMVVTVAEAKPSRLQTGIGYGSEEGPRGSLQWQHVGFLGGARQVSAEARYSSRLRGASVGLLEPYFFSPRLSFGAQANGWWTEEPIYTSRAFGGRTSLTFRSDAPRGPTRDRVDRTVRLQYINETLEYTIDPDALADATNFDELIALGLDPVTGSGSGRIALLDIDLDRTAVDQVLSPTRGHAISLHLGHAAPWLGGTFRYDEVGVDARLYLPVAPGTVWASRVHSQTILAARDADVPFSARYFLGGSSTLRGWGRFEVSPLTADGLPVGGRALLQLSSELRFPLRGSLSGVVFMDAGNVWADPSDLRVDDLRTAAGPGLRWTTPFGVVRADLGVQLARIPGLVVGGEPERRRWRIHFSFGHAF